MKAAQSRNLEILQLLVAAGAIVDLKSKQGLTALMYAVKNQNIPVAKELLLAGADRNARDKGGRTVVELAGEQGCEEMVELFQQQSLVSDTSVSGGRGKRDGEEVEKEVGRRGRGVGGEGRGRKMHSTNQIDVLL